MAGKTAPPPMVVLRKIGTPSKNRWMAKDVKLVARPHIGERITLDVYGRSTEVCEIEHVDGQGVMLVRLKPDYRGYSKRTSDPTFEEICEDYTSRGWYVWTMLDCSPPGEIAEVQEPSGSSAAAAG